MNWTIKNCANIGTHYGTFKTMEAALKAANQRNDGTMIVWIDFQSKIVNFRESVSL
jgi:hypothetical protein